MYKQKALFGTDSYFQLMIAVNLKITVYKDWDADIIIYGSVPSADIITKRLRETKIFNNVYLASTSLTLCGKKYTWYEKLPKYFVYLYSLVSPQQVVKNAIGSSINNSYDEFIMNGFGALPDAIFNACYRINKNVRIKRIEDGYESYYTEFGSRKGQIRKKLESIAQKLFGYKNIQNYISAYYYVEPELVIANLPYPIIRSPKFSRKNKELVQILNYVFEYDDNLKFLKKIYLFEDGYLFFMNSNEEVDIVKELKSIVKEDDFIVKMHPRRKENRFTPLGIQVMEKSNIPWEIIQLNNSFDGCIFITVASSIAFSSDIYFSDKCYKILLFQCLKNHPPKLINENFKKYLALYKEKFGENSLYIPKSYSELKEMIIKCYK